LLFGNFNRNIVQGGMGGIAFGQVSNVNRKGGFHSHKGNQWLRILKEKGRRENLEKI